METQYDNSIYYQSFEKSVSLMVSFLIGTKMEVLVDNNKKI